MFHTLFLVGNVGKDAEMRYTPSGQAVTSFSVATNHSYTGGDGNQVKETTWFRVTTWGKHAEVCNQYVKKGMKVVVEGRLTPDKATGGPRVWGDPPRASFEVNASTVRFLSSANDGAMVQEAQSIGGQLPPEDDDSIPF